MSETILGKERVEKSVTELQSIEVVTVKTAANYKKNILHFCKKFYVMKNFWINRTISHTFCNFFYWIMMVLLKKIIGSVNEKITLKVIIILFCDKSTHHIKWHIYISDLKNLLLLWISIILTFH